jgi:hypothetical protein
MDAGYIFRNQVDETSSKGFVFSNLGTLPLDGWQLGT